MITAYRVRRCARRHEAPTTTTTTTSDDGGAHRDHAASRRSSPARVTALIASPSAGLFAAWLAGVARPARVGPRTCMTDREARRCADDVGGADRTVLHPARRQRPAARCRRSSRRRAARRRREPARRTPRRCSTSRATRAGTATRSTPRTRSGGPRAQADAVGQLIGGVPISYVVDVDFAGFTSDRRRHRRRRRQRADRDARRFSGAFFAPGCTHMDGRPGAGVLARPPRLPEQRHQPHEQPGLC